MIAVHTQQWRCEFQNKLSHDKWHISFLCSELYSHYWRQVANEREDNLFLSLYSKISKDCRINRTSHCDRNVWKWNLEKKNTLWNGNIKLFRWLSPFFLLLFYQVDCQLPSGAQSEPRGHLALRIWRWTGGRGGIHRGYWPQGDPHLGLGSHFLLGVFSVSRHAADDSQPNSKVFWLMCLKACHMFILQNAKAKCLLVRLGKHLTFIFSKI